MNKRLLILTSMAAALLAFVLAFPAPQTNTATYVPAAKTIAATPKAAPANDLSSNVSNGLRTRDLSDPGNLFPVQVKAQPRRVTLAPVAAQPPPPTPAPQLPYRYLGRYEDSGTSMVLIWANERSVPIKPGDVLDDTFRVKTIAPDHIAFVHIPTQEELRLTIKEITHP